MPREWTARSRSPRVTPRSGQSCSRQDFGSRCSSEVGRVERHELLAGIVELSVDDGKQVTHPQALDIIEAAGRRVRTSASEGQKLRIGPLTREVSRGRLADVGAFALIEHIEQPEHQCPVVGRKLDGGPAPQVRVR